MSQPTGMNGTFGFSGLAQNTWQLQPSMNGDVMDAVGAADALYALETAVGMHPSMPAEQRLACDVTGNGSVGGFDAALILQYAVAEIAQLPAATLCNSEWVFFPHPVSGSGLITSPQLTTSACTAGSITYNPLSGGLAQQNFDAAVFGDCDGDWGTDGGGSGRPEAAGLRLGAPQLGRGSMVEIPVYVDRAHGLRAGDLVVRYDSRYLHAADVRALHAARGALLRYNAASPGLLRVALARLTSIDPGGSPALLLRFKIDGRKRTVAIRRAERAAIEYQRVR